MEPPELNIALEASIKNKIIEKYALESAPILRDFEQGEICLVDHSEDALAVEYANKHVGDLRYTHGMDWYVYNGQRWLKDTGLRRYDLARQLCRFAASGLVENRAVKLASASTINSVISLARSDPALNLDADQWDSDHTLLNTPGAL